MPLIFPKKTELPVFDIPTESIYKTDFVDRRILTIVGRAVLSEKNQPIKPSTDFKFRKCYSVSNDILYKLNRIPDDKASEPINYRVRIEELTDYTVPLAYYYNFRRIRQKSVYYPVDYKLSEEIAPFKTSYNNSEPLDIQIFIPSYPDKINIKKGFSYPEYAFRFNFQLQRADIFYNNILYETPEITNQKGFLQLNQNSILKSELSLENDYYQICLYDFSHFFTKDLDSMTPLGLVANLRPLEPNKQIVINKNSFESDYRINKVFRYLDNINYVWNRIYEELTTTEIFAKFYLTYNARLKPFVESLKTNNRVFFSLDISSFISDNHQNQSFETRNFNSKKQIDYKTLGQKNYNNLKAESISEFTIDLKNEKFDAYSLKKQILSGEKPLVVPIKYKSPRLALKLRINKPKLSLQDYICNIKDAKELKPVINISHSKKLLAKYSRIDFNHKIQNTFTNRINKLLISINTDYKLRRSNFFNKSPKHASYSYKAIHNIITKNAFKKDKRIKFLFKAFVLPELSLKSKESQGQNYKFNNLKFNRISYVLKPVNNHINLNRNNFNNILFTDKPKISSQNSSPADRLNHSKRIGLNHLKKLKLLILNIFKRKLKYQINFLVPQKKILPNRLKQPLKHSVFDLTVLKKSDELYSQKNRKTDCFNILNQNKNYPFSKYLPKQIIDQFNLVFEIIGIHTFDRLLQKEIIPPPGWKKEIKKYICCLKLGPYPFGFPEFAFEPPKFYQLTTRNKYFIKDTVNDYIYKESFFILTKDKLYVHDLSMKKPKRILHTDINPKNSPKEYYISKPDDKDLKQDQPVQIKSFTYSWLKENSIEKVVKGLLLFFSYQRVRNRKYLFKKLRTTKNNYDLKDNYIGNKLNSIMPQINRFLIQKSNYKLAKILGTSKQYGFINYWNTKISFYLKLEKNPDFVSKNLGCRITRQKDWTLPQFFPDTYPAKEVSEQYITRFRSFRFPYIPELSFTHEKAYLFAKETEDSSLYNCKFQADFRVSEFDFGLIELQNKYSDSYDSDYSNQNLITSNFGIKATNLFSTSLKDFIVPIISKPVITAKLVPEYCQHLITPKFFKVSANLSFKFKRRGQIISSLKYIQNLNLQKEQYYLKHDNLPSSFESASFHWIILLRKKKDIINNYKYLSDEQIRYKKEYSADYNFSSLSNKIIINESYPMPKINSFVREEFANTDYQNPIILPVSYISSYEFISKEYLNKQINLDIPKTTKNDLKDKPAYSYKLMSKEKYKGKVIESGQSIEFFGKSKLALSAFIIDRKKTNFKLTSSIKPRRIPYRPIYIPDFMDIDSKRDKIEINGDLEIRVDLEK